MSKASASEFFIFGFAGHELNSALHKYIAAHAVGGIIVFKHNIASFEQVIALNTSLINANKHHAPLICVDQEGGRVARLRGIISDILPLLNLREALLEDPHRAYRLGALMGRELVALGFNLNFAPVCDVVIEQEEHDIIGDRAFSHDATEAALLAAQFIQGMQGAGIAACAKHFPGHGSTTTDSHYALPVVNTSKELLEQREFLPFRAAINADVATIMTAHLIASSYDNNYPATMSEKILKKILRHNFNFNKVVISDDLDMKAIADNYDLREVLELSLRSSVDMFIIGNNLDKTFEAIGILQDLINNNSRLADHACLAQTRIKNLRERFLGKPLAPDLEQARLIVKSAPHLELLNSYR